MGIGFSVFVANIVPVATSILVGTGVELGTKEKKSFSPATKKKIKADYKSLVPKNIPVDGVESRKWEARGAVYPSFRIQNLTQRQQRQQRRKDSQVRLMCNGVGRSFFPSR